MTKKNHYHVLIVGGGAAGLSVAHSLLKKRLTSNLAIIEPSEHHYYQPMWTLVGAGVVKKEKTVKPTKSLIPKGAQWIQDSVTDFLPDENAVMTKNGKIFYDYLVATPGFELQWDKVKGLKESLGHNGVCSIYSYDTVDGVWDSIRNLKNGNAIFTFPSNPIKCGGAPQKIMYLAEHYFRKAKVRDKIKVTYMAASPSLFAVKKYADALMKKVVIPRQIDTCFQHNLIEVKGEEKEAVFENVSTKEVVTLKYDLLHVTPPMAPASFVQQSPLANKAGFIEVDQGTTQHIRYKNVFSIGDASSLPTSRTAAAVRASFPVLVENLALVMNNQEPQKIYDGYTSCPLLTRYGRVMLAEFDYNLNPQETLPFDQAKESKSAYFLKRFVIPVIYWKGMLKGKKWPLFV
jgi:sulfide:quinone oxidoreductase